jgi:hypothetical protein
LAAALALAALARAEPDYVEVACKLNGTTYSGGPLIQWQRDVTDKEGMGFTFKETFTGVFDWTLGLNSTLYHQFLRYHDIIYSFELRSGASAWRVDGHVEVNHTYSASLAPPVYTFPLWHPQYTSDKSVSGAVARYSIGWHSEYPYTFPAWTGSFEPSSPTSGLASIRASGSVNRIYVQLTVYNASGLLSLGVKLDIQCYLPQSGGGGGGGGGGGSGNATLTVLAASTKGDSLGATVSYSGTLSGSKTTPFTLSYNGNMTETLSTVAQVSYNGVTCTFRHWDIGAGVGYANPVTVTVATGQSKTAKAVYYCPNPPATLSFKTVELREETRLSRTEGWYLAVPFTLSYASEDGSVSGTVTGYTGFTTSYRVSDPPAAIIFVLSPQLGGEIYAPLRVWEWSSSGAGASYAYGNVTRADLYGGWLRTQELTGRYKLIYKVDYTDTEQTQPARVIVEKGSDAKGWTTLAVHDQPTSIILLDVELNSERVRFRAERVTSSGNFMAGVTAALAVPLLPFFKYWTADCSHLGECKFAADCTWDGWRNESSQVSRTPSTCLPVIAGVRPGETGYVTLWFDYPNPNALSVWAKDAASGRALLSPTVTVRWYDAGWGVWNSFNATVPASASGYGFNLTAYSVGNPWVGVPVNWQAGGGSSATQIAGVGAAYNVRVVQSSSLMTQQLTGTYLVCTYLVADNPGDSITLARTGSGVFASGTGKLQYCAPVSFNSQQLAIRVWNPSYTARASGWFLIAEKRNGTLNPVGWEVYKDGSLAFRASDPTSGPFGLGSYGSSYTAVALYSSGFNLTVKLVKPDGTPAYGAWIKVDNASYTDCADGRCDGTITVNVGAGPHTVEVLDTYYNKTVAERGLWNATSPAFDPRTHWQRYTFWKWSDSSAENPRTITVSNDTVLVVYVWDEKRLWVLYEPHYGSDPWGVKAVSLPDRYSGYINRMVPYGTSFWLRPGESFALQAVEGGAARFLRWDTATECYPRNPYSTDPVITRTIGSYGLAVRAVFRLGPSNQTLFLPGEGIPVPIFWPVYQQYAMGGCDGRRGAWLLNVSALTTQAQTAFAGDNRTWIYALLAKPGTLDSVWVPVNGSWELRMDKDWDALAHKLDDCDPSTNPYADACRYVAYDASSVSDFPQVASGAPSAYRNWRLIALAAWRPLLPKESYSGGAVSAVWLSNGTTLALYNVTFKHVDSGWVYWQPVAVSALKIESATAKYKLSSYDSQLRRSPIYMWIEAVVNWTYVPPNSTLPSLPPNVTLWMAGFKPHRIGNAGVALENDAGVVVWAARGSAHGTTGKLYTLSIGDTELFYREPRGLNFGARDFKLVARFVARAGQPGVRVDDGIPAKAEMSFKLAPATAFIAGFANNDPSQLIVDWSFFTSGSNPGAPGRRYSAKIYYEWGPVDPYNGTLPPLKRDSRINPTDPIPVNPDYWVAFYPIPYEDGEEKWTIKPGQEVPVPLYSKYPPRARG